MPLLGPIRSPRARHQGRAALTVAVALATLACCGLAGAALRGPAEGLAPGAELELRDDDGEAPMFVLGNLAPGAVAERCLAVTVSAGAPARVGLAGSGGGAGLEDQLELEVDAGAGGSFGSCAGFAGTNVYRGTLGDFLRRHPQGAGLEDWNVAADGEARTYRVRVRMRDVPEAEGLSATARLIWEGESTGAPEARLPPAPPAPAERAEPTPTAAPILTPPPQPAPGPTSRDAQPAPATATPVPDSRSRRAARARRRPAEHTAPAVRGGRPDSFVPAGGSTQARPRGLRATLSEIAAAIVHTIAFAAERGAFPAILFVLLASFLALQNRLDRRDPKLALAPVLRTPDLPFTPHPEPEPAE